MDRNTLLDALLSTADDSRLSRSERRALRQVLDAQDLDDNARSWLQHEVIEAVATKLRDPRDAKLVRWLGDTLGLLRATDTAPPPATKAWFGPEDPMVETILAVLRGARRAIDVAVFTITDDRISQELLAAHRRGVAVRILTDDDKAEDAGSDSWRLRRSGVPVAFDRSRHHFHHKFAVIDGHVLLNGSYNWTRSADMNNRENFMLSEEPTLVRRYARAFDALWAELGTEAGAPERR